MLVFDRVTRRFGSETALDAVSITFAAGSASALVGPNGSGKSTLLRIAATLDRPTSGQVRFKGADAEDWRARIGFSGHDAALYDALTARENVALRARLLGRPRPGEDADAALDLLGFPRRAADRRAGTLSRGLRQRVAVARAVLGEPDLVLLDEPHAGLDEEGAHALDSALAALAAAGAAMIVATHDLDRVRGRVDRVVALDRGRVARESPARSVAP